MPNLKTEKHLRKIKSIDDVNRDVAHLTSIDPDLDEALRVVQKAGMIVPLRLQQGGFAGLAEIVISQLLSKASAAAINQRFCERISPLTPESFVSAGEQVWREIGLSRAKQITFCAICEAIENGNLNLDKIEYLSVQEATLQLTSIKGVGPWTAEVYLLFCVGYADIFPAGDLALREAARLIWSLDERPDHLDLGEMVRKWSPCRGAAARLLWAYYAAQKQMNNR